MKTFNLKLPALFTIALFVLGACSSDFLEQQNTSDLTPPDLLTDVAGAETYLIGAYGEVQGNVSAGADGKRGYQIYWGTAGTDIVVIPSYVNDGRVDIYSQTVPPSLQTINDMWVEFYKSINRVNSVVDRVSAMTADQIKKEDQDRIVAEARFLRALLYFDLVVPFENIVLNKNEIVAPDTYSGEQSPPEDVYAFIIEDLRFAQQNLPTDQGNGRATQGAAQALLGKVYLQMTGYPLNQTDKFALAQVELEKVMNSSVYGLLPSYRDVFRLENENSREIVFSIGMDGPAMGEGGLLSTFYGPSGGGVNDGAGWGTCTVNTEFAQSYDAENDERSRNNIAKHSAGANTPEEGFSDKETWGEFPNGWRGWKWHASKPNNYPNDTPFDNIIIRYADVLLMHAEALNGQGNLTQGDMDASINLVRARARMADDALEDLVVGSQQENADAILNERRWELCFEGWRRNDLVRFGKYKETIMAIDQPQDQSAVAKPGANYQDYEIIWPIPQSEIDKYPILKQNPGY